MMQSTKARENLAFVFLHVSGTNGGKFTLKPATNKRTREKPVSIV
jgi:hypothetical protein